jgi:DNA-binding response OmpR family regulator
VQYIVKQSGGYLSVESEKGSGTAVRIYLPSCAQEKEPEVPRIEKAPPGGHETILIVQDSPEMRRFLRTALEGLGYSVMDAALAREAAALSSRFAEGIDLLVTDVVLADSSGLELARQLREARPGLPVLYISGSTHDSALLASVQESGGEFLAKPLTLAVFAERVRRILERQKRPRILFVDDDPDLALFAVRVLREAGFEALVAGNGRVALQTVETEHPDLVITDLVMPECEGLETIMTLHKSHPALPVIAISGAFGGQFLNTAVALGAHATLAKPFSGEELVKAVRVALERR